MPNESTAQVSDTSLLAALQLIQPANAMEMFEFAKESGLVARTSQKRIGARLSKLCSGGYLWETGDNRYVVTPLGSALAAASMKSRDRDKFRLLILNGSRRKRNLRWMHG